MALHSCITVDATTTLRQLLQLIADESDALYVAVRRFEASQIYWYAFPVGEIRARGHVADDGRLDAVLTDALDLHESGADTVISSGTPDDLAPPSGILVRGREAIGVIRPAARTRGGMVPRAPRGRARSLGPDEAAAPPGAPQDRKPFSAYPALTAPERVGSREEFTLDIGLATAPVAGVAGGPITGNVPADFDFELQIVADGFTAPDGNNTTLHVVRDRFVDASATVRLQAPDIADGPGMQGMLEVLFFFEGNLCGRALRMIAVGATAANAPAVTERGSASVSIPEMPAPDLTVTISRGSGDARLLWTMVAPTHPAPIGPVPHEFRDHTAKTFAFDRVRTLENWDKNPLTQAKFTGIAAEISSAMPNEFWRTLDEVWAAKQQAGGSAPSILIVSEDPYVPWELAALTETYAKAERLDPSRPPFLGAQARVGRWIPPEPTPFGGDRPSLPPVTSADVGDMVLFIGDYSAVQGHRPLPLAIEEGERLAERYGALERRAEINDVTDLIKDEVYEEGQRITVDAVHFACHGEINDNPKYNGIVLSDRDVRLGADMISGSEIGTSSSPFVFLNACQLGTESAGLDGNYGGLAGAFLDKGATAFIAPLWSVDDDIAQEFALDFYSHVFDERQPVAETLRELRSRFSMRSASPRASYLAYVYYGHPDLVIHKSGVDATGDDDDNT